MEIQISVLPNLHNSKCNFQFKNRKIILIKTIQTKLIYPMLYVSIT